jgi:hypothetical protein
MLPSSYPNDIKLIFTAMNPELQPAGRWRRRGEDMASL